MSDIRKREGKNGITYQVRFPNPSSKSGYSYKTFKTAKEARYYRENSYVRLKGATTKHRDIQSVSQAVDKWLDICEKEGLNGRDPVTLYTLQNYRYRAEYIKRYTWSKLLHKLQPPDIVDFRSWLLRSDISRDLSRKVLSTLQSVMKEMSLRGIITSNVASGVSIHSESRYDQPIIVPQKKDVLSLLSAADRLSNSRNTQIAHTWQRYRPLLYLAVDTGMRPQEYLAVSHSSLKDNGIWVTRAIDGGGSKITVTKTKAGRRFIEVGADTLDMVKHYAENHSQPNEHDLIFPANNGNWLCRRNWKRRGFDSACKQAGLTKEVVKDGKTEIRSIYRPYDLRHFYASMLLERKVNLKKVQTLMGHENIETTFNVYGHLLEDEASSFDSNGIISQLN